MTSEYTENQQIPQEGISVDSGAHYRVGETFFFLGHGSKSIVPSSKDFFASAVSKPEAHLLDPDELYQLAETISAIRGIDTTVAPKQTLSTKGPSMAIHSDTVNQPANAERQVVVDANDPKPRQPAIFTLTDEQVGELPDFEQEVSGTNETNTPLNGQNLSADILQRLLQKEKILSESATKPVVFSPPLISRSGIGVVGRSTVNIIQGAFGSHKSRLAELLASLMLTTHDANDPQFLGFTRAVMERFCVCYLDTERNKREELPHAIQGIKVKAGYSLTDQPADFRFTSIKGEKRADRFNAIELFIRHVRQQTPLHLFCLIDVVTDAIGDFNDPKQSMQLFDFLGNLSDDYNATFLLVIHQNPGTEKARGHAGTEAANKASTVLQIGFEKDANGNDTDLIRLRYLKLRRGKRPEPVFLCYSDEVKGLVLANDSQVAANASQRQTKAPVEEVVDSLIKLLSKAAVLKNEVWASLEAEFGAGNATIRNRLKTIMEDQPQMFDDEGRAVRLTDFTTDKSHFYKLSLLE